MISFLSSPLNMILMSLEGVGAGQRSEAEEKAVRRAAELVVVEAMQVEGID